MWESLLGICGRSPTLKPLLGSFSTRGSPVYWKSGNRSPSIWSSHQVTPRPPWMISSIFGQTRPMANSFMDLQPPSSFMFNDLNNNKGVGPNTTDDWRSPQASTSHTPMMAQTFTWPSTRLLPWFCTKVNHMKTATLLPSTTPTDLLMTINSLNQSPTSLSNKREKCSKFGGP